MKKKSTYNLGFQKLNQLLALGTGCAVPEANLPDSDRLNLALCSHLTTPLGQASDLIKPLLTKLEAKKVVINPDRLSLTDILLDPNTSIDILRILKAYGKELANTIPDKLEQAMGTTLYHGAIAAAVVFHNKKITSTDALKLENAFALLAKKDWTPPAIKQLFERAKGICAHMEVQ